MSVPSIIAPRASQALWSLISKCSGKECPLHSSCPHHDSSERCAPELSTLSSIHDSLIDSIPVEARVPELMNDIGFKLMPLYQILIKLYLHHDSDRVVYSTAGGRKAVNPILREIRSTIKDIDSVQRTMGMGGSYLRAIGGTYMGLFKRGSAVATSGDSTSGDSSYYDSLMEEAVDG